MHTDAAKRTGPSGLHSDPSELDRIPGRWGTCKTKDRTKRFALTIHHAVVKMICCSGDPKSCHWWAEVSAWRTWFASQRGFGDTLLAHVSNSPRPKFDWQYSGEQLGPLRRASRGSPE